MPSNARIRRWFNWRGTGGNSSSRTPPTTQFADAYAQTVTFALLLGRSEGATGAFTLESAEAALAAQHSLLARALQVLTDPSARADIDASLDLLLRIIAVVPPTVLAAPGDPWLYFYEDFLAAYDPKLRKDAGVYYTPVEVVRAQVRLIDDLLVHRLGKPLGFADAGVVTLDPAVGTGTYLLGVNRARAWPHCSRAGRRRRGRPSRHAGRQPVRLRAHGRPLLGGGTARQPCAARPAARTCRRTAPTCT